MHWGGEGTKKESNLGCWNLSLLSTLGGGYLLSRFRSTIGAVRLNFSVRNGKRWNPHTITTLVSVSVSDPLSRGGRRLCCQKKVLTGNAAPGSEVKLRSLWKSATALMAGRHCACLCFDFVFFRRLLACLGKLRAISTARLRPLLTLHLPPINVVVFNGPYDEILSCGWLRA